MLHHKSEVTAAGDMWAMGIILFMLLGGYPPFTGKSNAEIVANIKAGDIKWYRSRFEKISKVGYFLGGRS